MHFFRHCCHQDPQKSFFIGKYQMPICARCLGTYIGYVIGIIISACSLFLPISITYILLSVMLFDWMMQNLFN